MDWFLPKFRLWFFPEKIFREKRIADFVRIQNTIVANLLKVSHLE